MVSPPDQSKGAGFRALVEFLLTTSLLGGCLPTSEGAGVVVGGGVCSRGGRWGLLGTSRGLGSDGSVAPNLLDDVRLASMRDHGGGLRFILRRRDRDGFYCFIWWGGVELALRVWLDFGLGFEPRQELLANSTEHGHGQAGRGVAVQAAASFELADFGRLAGCASFEFGNFGGAGGGPFGLGGCRGLGFVCSR